EMHAGITLVNADQFGDSTLDHFNDARFALAETVASFSGDLHAIAVHHRQHLPRRHKQVFQVALVRDNKAKAIAVTLDAAADQVHAAGQPELALAVLHQLAVTDHGSKASLERHLVFFFGH